MREMLEGSRQSSRVDWPDSLAAAFGTRAFAGEVRAVLAKARQLGMDPDDVTAAGEAAERPEWQAVGAFFDEYLDVLDAEQVLDYAELVHRSRILLADPAIVAQLRAEITAVFVDEYQDTDPAQVRLLQAIAGDGRDVVVVGDPDQSVYAFRGAEARGLLDFPDLFPTAAGRPAPDRRSRLLHAGSASALAGGQPQHRQPAESPADAAAGGVPGLSAAGGGVQASPAAGWRPSPVRRRAPRPSRSPSSCARPTCAMASNGHRWPCWSGRESG